MRSSTDEELLDAKPKVVEDARLHQTLRQGEGTWHPSLLRLEMGLPMPRQLQMDPIVAQFVGQFDGTRALRELVQKLAVQVETDLARVSQESPSITKKLIEEGFLVCDGKLYSNISF